MFISNPYEISTLRTGLKALYLPNTGSGSTWPDSSGNGNTATRAGTTSWASNTFNGRPSLVLNGTGTATIPASSTLNAGTQSVTFAAWVYVRNAPGSGSSYLANIFTNEGSSGGSAFFRLGWGDFNRRLNLTGGFYNGSFPYVTSDYALPTGQWVFVAITTDGSKMKFYANGSFQQESNFTATANTGTNGYTIGGGSGRSFDGSIGMIAYYPKRCLSAPEIKGLYEWTK